MFLLYFLLLLVVLVVFHEFGHFIVARWMGVRVLSFSVGFGPTVVRWERGGTEYAVRALPLGGFVRMLGEDPSAPMDPEVARDPQAFHNKPVWRRALIVAAGPIFNLILPIFILFFGAMMFDGQVVSTRLGTVLPEGPAAQAGLRTGDRILQIDGVPVHTFRELKREIERRPGRGVPVVYERQGQRLTTRVTPSAFRDVRIPELGLVSTKGRIEVLPDAETAEVAVDPESPAWQAGLRSGDRIVAVDGKKTTRYYDLADALRVALASGKPVTLEVAPLSLPGPTPKAERRQVFDKAHATQTRKVQLPVGQARDAEALGLHPAELVVGTVDQGSPADVQAGLLPGDEIVQLDGQPARSFVHFYDVLTKPFDDVRADPANRGLAGEEMVERMNQALAKPHALVVRHALRPSEIARIQELLAGKGKAETPTEKAVLAAPNPSEVLAKGWIDRPAQLKLQAAVDREGRPTLEIGLLAVQDHTDPEMIANPDRLGHALLHTREKMSDAVDVTLRTVAGLLRGHVPVREVGGPIFMAQLASRTADLGWGYFFELMVWLSVNLAILNLLPIPLVDGGHLLFLGIEAIRREPVSLRTRQVAAYVGMSFLGLLFVVVMKNDVQRLLAALAD